MILLLHTTIQDWSPGIGDASLAGWFTVLLYTAAAALCRRRLLHVRVQDTRTAPRPGVALWTAFSLALLALAINKLLNLSSAITALGRTLAELTGWYDNRRDILAWCVLALGFATLMALATALHLTRRASRRARIAIAAMIALLAFIAARASSWHDFESVLGARLLGLKVNWIAECACLSLIAFAAAWQARSRSATPPRT